jgi:Fe-S cluster assembly protein SufD
MTETPHIITRKRRVETVEKDFQFDPEMIPNSATPGLQSYRMRAWEAFKSLPMPTVKDEPWRRTDIHALNRGFFRFPEPVDYKKMEPVPQELLDPVADEENGGELVLSPGKVNVFLNESLVKKGVIFSELAVAEMEHPELIDRLKGQIVRADEDRFTAMVAAMASTGVVLYVPKNVQVMQPLHSIYWGPGKQIAHLSHLLIWLEDGASVTYVHESASNTEKDCQSLHAGIVEIRIGSGANLRFVELQSWGEHIWNFTHERVQVERDGNLDWIFGAIGSHLTKNFSDLDLVGQGATGRMSGFYFTDHNQHLDHDTQQNHLAPNTTSDLLFKGALQDESRSVWQGMIYVAPGAVKTDGYQANRNLVISPKARADSIPGLEILADDVRCTHGATVGKIDAEQVFYLRSRGIPQDEAERLIVEGFFDPIMQRIPFEGVRRRFQLAIHEKMERRTGV